MKKQAYWCVVEIRDGKRHPISKAFEHVVDAEERKNKLLETEEYKDNNLQVIEASYPVDPRKPPRRRKR